MTGALEPVRHSPATRDLEQAINQWVLNMDDQRKALVEAGDYESLADGFDLLDRIIRQLRTLKDSVGHDAAQLLPKKWVEVDGLGTVEKATTSKTTRWEHDEVTKAVLEAGWDEISHPNDVAALLRRVAGISYWRVGELQKLGLDANEFREVEPGRPTIRVHKAGEHYG